MLRRLVVPPVVEPVSLGEAKQHLRVDHSDEDALIAVLIQSARQEVETLTGRFLMRQTVDLSFDAFADPLPLGAPLVDAVSVSYVDPDGATQVLSPSIYAVEIPSVAPEPPGTLRLAFGATWPALRDVAHAVTVRTVLGAAQPSDVPPALRAAMLLLIADLFENREAQAAVTLAENKAVSRLLAPWVLQWF